jgi:hypothetical protein
LLNTPNLTAEVKIAAYVTIGVAWALEWRNKPSNNPLIWRRMPEGRLGLPEPLALA